MTKTDLFLRVSTVLWRLSPDLAQGRQATNRPVRTRPLHHASRLTATAVSCSRISLHYSLLLGEKNKAQTRTANQIHAIIQLSTVILEPVDWRRSHAPHAPAKGGMGCCPPRTTWQLSVAAYFFGLLCTSQRSRYSRKQRHTPAPYRYLGAYP